jgi:hypothetical protein
MAQSSKPEYAVERYFVTVPADVHTTLTLEGVRPLHPGSKFKIANTRGEFIFLYERGGTVTCLTSQGQFFSVRAEKITRTLNRTPRERAAA